MGAAAVLDRQVPPAIPFAEFLHALRRNGFSVGLRHYARLMTVLEQVGPDCAPHQLRTMICPLFATTAEQQDRFYRLFDQWFPLFCAPATTEHIAPDRGAPDVPVPPIHRGVAARRRSWLWPSAAASLVVVAVALSLLLRPVTPTERPADSAQQPDIVANVQPTPVPQPQPVDAPPASRALLPPPVRNSLLFLLLAGFVGLEILLYRRRRLVIERQRRERPPLVWPIRVESASTPLEESSDFFVTARRLRERQTGERTHLDIEQTIAATVQALGFPVLRYTLETQPPEYLVLVERVAKRDHQAGLYSHLVERLTDEGVHAAVYWFESDPRACEPAGGGAPVLLSELRRRFPAHRLIIFSTGDGLIDPITGRRKAWVSESLAWPDRAVLTPEPVDHWGAREVALGSHFLVLPATIAGLQAAVDHFQLPSRDSVTRRNNRRLALGSHVPSLSGADCVRVLRHHVGESGLQWVCACAVYPELQWQLTLHLGMLHEVNGGTIDDALLMRLVRLPWFRTGSIPDEARAILLRVIRPEVDRAARTAVLALLERNPAPAETIASTSYELDLVVQKLALHGRERARRNELLRLAQRMPQDKVVRELAVLRLSEHDPTTRLAMRLPERFRSVFFQHGIPVLGLTTGARSTVAAALVAGVLLAGREPAPKVPANDLALAGPDTTAARANDTTRRASQIAALDTAAARAAAARRPADPAAPNPARLGAGTIPSTASATGGDTRVADVSVDSLRALFQQAVRLFDSFQVEQAYAILTRIAGQAGRLPDGEAAGVFKYLGASFAILAQEDSAIAWYSAALERDPFTELDPTRFSATELQPFEVATARVLRLGLKAPAAVGDSLVRFTFTTTQQAEVTIEATQQNGEARELLFRGRSVGPKVVVWDGRLLSAGGAAAQPGVWTVRVSASRESGPPLTATATFDAPSRPANIARAQADASLANNVLCSLGVARLRDAALQASGEVQGNWTSFRDNRVRLRHPGATTEVDLPAVVEFVADPESRVQRAMGRSFNTALSVNIPDVARACEAATSRPPADSTELSGAAFFEWRDAFGVNMTASGNATLVFVRQGDRYIMHRIRIRVTGR